MDGAGFRSLIIFLLLAIFAFVAGSLASDDAQGALIPSALILGAFFLIYLGKNCWILLFIAPIVLFYVPLPWLQSYPVADVVCAIVLCYMLVLRMTGYINLKWKGFLLLDIATLLLFLYMAASWVRNPVTVRAFVSITDYGDAQVGGKEYLFFVGAVFSYIAVSLVQVKMELLLKVLKWAFWIAVFLASFYIVKGVIGGTVVFGDQMTNSRYSTFVPVAQPLYSYLLSKYSLVCIFMSPVKIIFLVATLAAILLGGYRTFSVNAVFFVYIVSVFHKQLVFLIILSLASWGGLIYLSQQEGVMDAVPYGIRRTLTIVPCVEFTEQALNNDVKSSTEWRVEMWKWALDPSKGYIDDYVWGDGYGLSYHNMQWQGVLVGLNLRQGGDNELFAETGSWHNAAISVLQHLGAVGVGLVFIWYVAAVYLVYIVCISMRGWLGSEYVYVILCPIVTSAFTFWFLPGDMSNVFKLCSQIAMAKLLYSSLIEKAAVLPLFGQKVYVPQIMRASSFE